MIIRNHIAYSRDDRIITITSTDGVITSFSLETEYDRGLLAQELSELPEYAVFDDGAVLLRDIALDYPDIKGWIPQLWVITLCYTQYCWVLNGKPPREVPNPVAIMREMQDSLNKNPCLKDILIRECNIAYIMQKSSLDGIKIDIRKFKMLEIDVRDALNDVERHLYENARIVFNPDLPANLVEIEREDARRGMRYNWLLNKKGKKAATVEALDYLIAQGSIVALLLKPCFEYQLKLNPIIDIIKALQQSPQQDRIYPLHRTIAASTHRFTIQYPCLSNLKKGSDIRGCITAEIDSKIASFDFETMEPKAAAIWGGDCRILQIMGTHDIYLFVMREMQPTPAPVPDESNRKYVKTAVLQALYGAGSSAIDETLAPTPFTARELLTVVHKHFPGFFSKVKRLHEKAISSEAPTYFVHEIWGKKYYLPPKTAPNLRACCHNYPIQSLAREIFCDALINLDLAGKTEGLLFTVHDEFVYSIPEQECDKRVKSIKATASTDYPFNDNYGVALIPFVVGGKVLGGSYQGTESDSNNRKEGLVQDAVLERV